MHDGVPLLQDNDGAAADEGTSLWRLQQLLTYVPAPVFVFDLSSRRGLFGNEAAASLMRTTRPQLQQMLNMKLTELAGPDAAARIEQGLSALGTGAVRSYHAERTYADCAGELIHAHHAVTRLELCDEPPVAVGMVTRCAAGHIPGVDVTTPSATPALVALDHRGRVEATSPEVEPMLGLAPTGLLGRRLGDVVHPADERDLQQAIKAASRSSAATTTVCLRVGADWRSADLTFGSLCRHQPYRLGVLMTLHREARLAAAVSCPPAGGGLVLRGQRLTGQQAEVVTRLLRGESIAVMAAAMHLSRSTVRNHLCAVYAKVGVHSQAELVARVTGRQPNDREDPSPAVRELRGSAPGRHRP